MVRQAIQKWRQKGLLILKTPGWAPPNLSPRKAVTQAALCHGHLSSLPPFWEAEKEAGALEETALICPACSVLDLEKLQITGPSRPHGVVWRCPLGAVACAQRLPKATREAPGQLAPSLSSGLLQASPTHSPASHLPPSHTSLHSTSQEMQRQQCVKCGTSGFHTHTQHRQHKTTHNAHIADTQHTMHTHTHLLLYPPFLPERLEEESYSSHTPNPLLPLLPQNFNPSRSAALSHEHLLSCSCTS